MRVEIECESPDLDRYYLFKVSDTINDGVVEVEIDMYKRNFDRPPDFIKTMVTGIRIKKKELQRLVKSL